MEKKIHYTTYQYLSDGSIYIHNIRERLPSEINSYIEWLKSTYDQEFHVVAGYGVTLPSTYEVYCEADEIDEDDQDYSSHNFEDEFLGSFNNYEEAKNGLKDLNGDYIKEIEHRKTSSQSSGRKWF